jgi:hypothetical protein
VRHDDRRAVGEGDDPDAHVWRLGPSFAHAPPTQPRGIPASSAPALPSVICRSGGARCRPPVVRQPRRRLVAPRSVRSVRVMRRPVARATKAGRRCLGSAAIGARLSETDPTLGRCSCRSRAVRLTRARVNRSVPREEARNAGSTRLDGSRRHCCDFGRHPQDDNRSSGTSPAAHQSGDEPPNPLASLAPPSDRMRGVGATKESRVAQRLGGIELTSIEERIGAIAIGVVAASSSHGRCARPRSSCQASGAPRRGHRPPSR